jgi:uncharacterized cupin superfamily protein
MEPAPGVFTSTTWTDEWEFDPEVDGDLHLLCSAGGVEAGMSRFTGPEREPVTYTPPKRETLIVIEGEARVELRDGPTLELKAGVMASIPGGTETTWHITRPFQEFWVIAD